LGAVGILQFDVTMARLKDEYGADAVTEPADYARARWIECIDKRMLDQFERENKNNLALDAQGHLTYLARSEWSLDYEMKQWPEIKFLNTREHS
ncbi:MAG: peptide chain release factor 3, partial [Desulfobacteraceae bacterium]